MPPRAVLLDLYDTMANGDWYAWRAHLADLTGIDPDRLSAAYHVTRLERNIGVYDSAEDGMRHVLRSAGIRTPDEDLVRRATDAELAFGVGVGLYDDVLPTVAALRERGSRLAVVSNCSHATRAIVDRLGFDQLFDTVVLSFEVGVRKPDAGIYEATLAQLGVDAPDALFVDDQTAYCDGARALGIDTRLIVRDDTLPAEGVSILANGHTVIADLTSIL